MPRARLFLPRRSSLAEAGFGLYGHANIEALIIRIGFGGSYTIMILGIRNHNITNYLGFYINSDPWGFGDRPQRSEFGSLELGEMNQCFLVSHFVFTWIGAR